MLNTLEPATQIPVPQPLISKVQFSFNSFRFNCVDSRGGLRTSQEALNALNYVFKTKVGPIYVLKGTQSLLQVVWYWATWSLWGWASWWRWCRTRRKRVMRRRSTRRSLMRRRLTRRSLMTWCQGVITVTSLMEQMAANTIKLFSSLTWSESPGMIPAS